MHAHDLDELHEKHSADEILAEVSKFLGLPLNTPTFTIFRVSRRRYHQREDMAAVCDDYGKFCEERRVPLCVASWVLGRQPEPAT